MYTDRNIKKIAGVLPAEPKKEKQGYIGDLSKKTTPQLNELLERQLKLLANRAFLNKLADKGEKMTKLKNAIEEELKCRDESEKLSKMLSGLSMNGKEDLDALEWTGRCAPLSKMLSGLSMNGKEDLDALEWTGRCAPGHVKQEEEGNESDDEQNPLKILATHSGAGFHKKEYKVIKPEETLIKPSDMDIDGAGGEEIEEYAKQLCDKVDSVKPEMDQKHKFFPNKTLKQKKVESHKKKVKRGMTKWEVTAATPPAPVHGDTKLVSLQESLRLQAEQQQKLKEIHMRHAAERLGGGLHHGFGRLPQLIGTYRDPALVSRSDSGDEGSEHEVHDDEYPDGGGVTVYNLVDDTND